MSSTVCIYLFLLLNLTLACIIVFSLAWTGLLAYLVMHWYGQRIRAVLPFSFFARTILWVRTGVDAEWDRAARGRYLRTGPGRYELRATCRTENVGHFYYCLSCRTQPFRGAPVPRDPNTTVVRIDV